MDRDQLVAQIDALLHLDESGKLVPHGIGGLARELLQHCRDEIARPVPAPTPTIETRVRQSRHGWQVDRRWLGLIWLPVGRWIHQDWWAPYVFDSAEKAITFATEYAK